jgi:outer membrane receptor for ferrienterochelin and colicins
MKPRWMCLLVSSLLIETPSFSQTDDKHDAIALLDSLLNIRVSSASKYDQSARRAPASVTIVTSDEIERFGYRTLDEILVAVCGFYTSYDRTYSYLGVRGFSRPTDYADRLLLLVDGHTINENVYGSASIGTDLSFSMDGIDRVEIVRGPGSVLYGDNAMLAVVNIIMKEGKEVDGVNLTGAAGSYGERRVSLTAGKQLDNGLDFMLSGVLSSTDGQDLFFPEFNTPETNNGMANSLDWDRYHGIQLNASLGDFSLTGHYGSREKGIPTASFDVIFNNPGTQALDERGFAELKWEQQCSPVFHAMARGYFDHYGYKGWSAYDMIDYDASDGNWVGGEIQARWDPFPIDRFTAGVEYKNSFRADYRYWNDSIIHFSGDFPFSSRSLYLENELQIFPELSFTIGGRFDYYTTTGSTATPRAALVATPFRTTTFKLLYGEAYRSPNIYETQYTDPVLGYIPNPSLVPEHIRTSELVWEQRLADEWFGTVDLYDYRMRDLIDQQVNPIDSTTQFHNISEVVARGVEIQFRVSLPNDITASAGYAYQHATDDLTGEWLTNSPLNSFRLSASAPLCPWLIAALQCRYDSERKTVYGTNTSGYVLTNITLRVPKVTENLSCAFTVRNAGNVPYETPGGYEHRMPGILQDGRNFLFTAGYSF